MPLPDYMALCLTHPDYGYYTNANPFGTSGDFITAPEISQMFGELLGLLLVDTWEKQGAPKAFSLLELGPGRGTLMADALRAARLRPAFLAALNLYFLEASPKLQQAQQQAVTPIKAHFISTLGTLPTALPAQPIYFIANEFFDALPVSQYRLTARGWVQRAVSVTESALAFTELPATPPNYIVAASNSTPVTDWLEYSAATASIMQALCLHLSRHGGAGVIIDYGYAAPNQLALAGDSLQAVRRHQFADSLSQPGEVDLTTHVNFGLLQQVAQQCGCRTHFSTQGDFLHELGIDARAAQLGDSAGLMRLTDPEHMGSLFKVLQVNT